jgi:hypothetical protein
MGRFFDPKSPVVARVQAAVGLVVTSGLLLLGGSWPSAYTLAALLVLPAFVVQIAVLITPGKSLRHRWVRGYLGAAIAVSAGLLLTEVRRTIKEPWSGMGRTRAPDGRWRSFLQWAGATSGIDGPKVIFDESGFTVEIKCAVGPPVVPTSPQAPR